MSQRRSNNPIDSLHQNMNSEVIVKIKRNRTFQGVLKSCDPHLNVLLENVVYRYSIENEDGTTETKEEKFPQTILRGDNIIFIGLAK